MIRSLVRRWRQSLNTKPYAWVSLAAACLLALTLLHPKLPQRSQLVHALIVIDITQSMGVEDTLWKGKRMARIEQAKAAAIDLLHELPCGSEIGVGLFNEYRTFVLLAPIEVCENFHELSTSIETLNNRMSWAGASEIAKGINSGLQSLKALPNHPALVFLTDGQESPPISFLHRPKIAASAGEFKGVLVGVGGYTLQAIPKFDPDGHRIGVWKPDEVAQVDIYSQGRESSVAGESYVEDPNDNAKSATTVPPPSDKKEHLSAVREEYLGLIAREIGFGYLHLTAPHEIYRSLTQAGATEIETRWGDGRWALAWTAFVLLFIANVGFLTVRDRGTQLIARMSVIKRSQRTVKLQKFIGRTP